MNGFYEKLGESYQDCDIMAVTILDGKYFGEKALFSEKKLIFETTEDVFSQESCDELCKNFKNGVLNASGQRFYCEVIGNEKKLILCGAGHVSIPIIIIGKMLGFHVTVIEDRPLYANHARDAKADEVLCEDFCEALRKIKGDADTYFVIVTRGHRYDLECLEEILKKQSAYVGMIGSRLRVNTVKEMLIEKGIDKERLNQIHAPIGLAIGAETPEEIAVAIMAEIIEVKNRTGRSGGFNKELKKAISMEAKGGLPKILATIVARKGSAPREIGTKMLIFKDGTAIGTIGGGCVEAEVCRMALTMLSDEDRAPKLYTVDMTGQDAEKEGMVCGGVVEILLERIE